MSHFFWKRLVRFSNTHMRWRVLAGLAAALFVSSWFACGDDDPTSPAGLNDIRNRLVFTREDASELIMGTDYAVCCAAWEPGFNDRNTLKLFFYDPDQNESGWKLFLITEEIEVGTTYSLPSDSSSPFRMFIFDVSDQNELSSDIVGDSSGTLTVDALSCGPPLTVSITFDLTLGSEFFQGPSVEVSGSFGATVYANPSPLGCDFGL